MIAAIATLFLFAVAPAPVALENAHGDSFTDSAPTHTPFAATIRVCLVPEIPADIPTSIAYTRASTPGGFVLAHAWFNATGLAPGFHSLNALPPGLRLIVAHEIGWHHLTQWAHDPAHDHDLPTLWPVVLAHYSHASFTPCGGGA